MSASWEAPNHACPSPLLPGEHSAFILLYVHNELPHTSSTKRLNELSTLWGYGANLNFTCVGLLSLLQKRVNGRVVGISGFEPKSTDLKGQCISSYAIFPYTRELFIPLFYFLYFIPFFIRIRINFFFKIR